jgi:uncharacterized membrane protein
MPMSELPRKLLFRLAGLKSRVTLAALLAAAIYLLTFRLEIGLRIALAYDFSVASFLTLLGYRVNHTTALEVKNHYENRDPTSRYAVIAAVVFSSLSMAGVALMADISQTWDPVQANMHAAFSLLAIVLSWVLLHAFYAFHYAHLYYDVDEGDPERSLRKGLKFPTDDPPDYWDFLYYSFTIAMCFQSSDVTIVGRSMRRVTLFHAILSFLYVTAILGLVINILSNQI